MKITVVFDDREALEAASQAVARANEATGTPDDPSTPIFRAERVLDSALLATEEIDS